MKRYLHQHLTILAAMLISFFIALTTTSCSDAWTKQAAAQTISGEKNGSAAPSAAGTVSMGGVPDVQLSQDMKKIKDRGKIIFGLYQNDMPPFFMTDKAGKLYGLDIDLANGMATELGVEAVFDRSASSYRNLFIKLAEGKVDAVVAKFSRTDYRAEYVRFSTPYVELRLAIMMNKKLLAKLKIDDNPVPYLKEKDNKVTIGVSKGSSYVEFAGRLFPEAEIVEFSNKENMFQGVIDNAITACLYDENEFAGIVRQKADISLYTTVYVFNELKDYICVAVPPESTQLLSWINTYMENGNYHWDIKDMMDKYPEVYKTQEK